MKAEFVYEKVCEMLIHSGNEHIVKNPHSFASSWMCYEPSVAESAAADLLIAAKLEMDQKSSPGKIISAVKRIIRDGERFDLPGLVESKGRFIACSGYHLVRLKQDISGLPHIERSERDFDKLVSDAENKCSHEFSLPSFADIIAFKAERKAKGMAGKQMPMKIDDALYVDPNFLIDMIQALPGCKAFRVPDSSVSAIYFVAENGDGVLLPVRH